MNCRERSQWLKILLQSFKTPIFVFCFNNRDIRVVRFIPYLRAALEGVSFFFLTSSRAFSILSSSITLSGHFLLYTFGILVAAKYYLLSKIGQKGGFENLSKPPKKRCRILPRALVSSFRLKLYLLMFLKTSSKTPNHTSNIILFGKTRNLYVVICTFYTLILARTILHVHLPKIKKLIYSPPRSSNH